MGKRVRFSFHQQDCQKFKGPQLLLQSELEDSLNRSYFLKSLDSKGTVA
jgi:hypothetical protein